MSTNKRLLIKNSFIGLMSQIVSVFLQFASRGIFIKYIGIEMIGINGTFASILSTLSLSEMGIQTAIIYNLYKPIRTGDTEKINEVLNIYKFFYTCIGVFFTIASLFILPFLQLFLKNTQVNNSIYFFFIIQASSSIASYFFSYKRALLFADQKDYLTKAIDTTIAIICKISQIMVVITTQNYALYLIIQLAQTILSNFLINIKCRKIYPFLKPAKLNKNYFKSILNNIKDVFFGKLASYVFTSTDNLVISSLLGASFVGYLTNYSVVTLNLKLITNSILGPISPMIGTYLADSKSIAKETEMFNLNTYIRYIIAIIILVPTYILIDDFIILWLGPEYLLSNLIKVLLLVDLYINLVHSSCCDFISGKGLFREEKYIQILGATMNIITSIILVKYYGIVGVLFGTIISEIFFWISRSILVYKKCFQTKLVFLLKYWLKNVIYLLFIIFITFISNSFYKYFIATNGLLTKLIIGGFVTEIISLISILFLFLPLNEHVRLMELIKNMIKNYYNRKVKDKINKFK